MQVSRVSFQRILPVGAATVVGQLQPLAIAGRRPVLLLVEDNEVNQLLGQALLERLDCAVDIAPDGAEAIGAAGRRRYDLVLMDVLMPVLDGREATRRLRALGMRVPIVALTAAADGHAGLLAAGFSACLVKPASAAVLRAAIARALATAA